MKIKLKMKNYNMILKEKQQKYQLYHLVKLISMKPSNQKQIIEQAKFFYSPLGKALKNKQKLLKIKEKNK